jgi:hypothetical protein
MILYAWVGGSQDITGPPWTGQSVIYCLMFTVMMGLVALYRKQWNLRNPISWSTFSLPMFFYPLFLLLCLLENTYDLQPEMSIAIVCNGIFSTLGWATPSLWRFLPSSAGTPSAKARVRQSIPLTVGAGGSEGGPPPPAPASHGTG